MAVLPFSLSQRISLLIFYLLLFPEFLGLPANQGRHYPCTLIANVVIWCEIGLPMILVWSARVDSHTEEAAKRNTTLSAVGPGVGGGELTPPPSTVKWTGSSSIALRQICINCTLECQLRLSKFASLWLSFIASTQHATPPCCQRALWVLESIE